MDKMKEPADGCTREEAERQAEEINRYWRRRGVEYQARAVYVHSGVWGVRSKNKVAGKK